MLLKYLLIFTLVACFNVRALSEVSDGYKCSAKIKINQSGQSIISSIGNYSKNSRCSWLIESGSAAVIRLHIENFETESGYDNLYIYHGDGVFAPLIAALSGYLPDRREIEIHPADSFVKNNKALLYFSSDGNTNLAGFNITYYKCIPTVTISGDISCETQKPSCPNSCFNEMGYGECLTDSHFHCSKDYVGDDCGQKVSEGIWEVISISDYPSLPKASAGHCAYVSENKQYIVGGIRYPMKDPNQLIQLVTFSNRNRVLTSSPVKPQLNIWSRYGHSCIQDGMKGYLYGGMYINSRDTNGLWMYDMSVFPREWKYRIEPSTQCSEDKLCAPIKVSGHTANLIKDANGVDKMLVIFGYSSKYGYLDTVQEYELETRAWQIVNTSGFPVKGSYGHTSIYDESSNIIYVYGGLVSAFESSNQLYAYHTFRQEWKLAAPAPSEPRYLHSAVLVSKNLMLIFGGKTSNMYQSPDTIVYDLACDSWQQYRMPEGIGTSRYGHSAVMYNETMYIYSGFDGQMIPNMLRFTPGTCEQYENSSQCLRSQVGLKCLWIEDTKSCKALKDVHNYTGYSNCLEHTEQIILRMKACQGLSDCASCTQTTNDCVWCDGVCSYRRNCTDKTANVIDSPAMCDKAEPKESQMTFPDENCSEITSCGDCTETASCIWCQNQRLCVSRYGYPAVFPYGQCRDSNIFKEQCLDVNASTFEWCSVYKNCTECGNDLACGWCDDLSGTGTGKCLHGSARGSFTCRSSDQWYFTECPRCQCNGHSTCHPESGDCIEPCNDFTEGPHCDRCQPGHWGNPTVNGGKCKVCECASHNYCDDKTGKCLTYCETIGVTGDLCKKCDTKKGYVEGPSPGSCYYNLVSDYKYTFNLTSDGFKAQRKINFKSLGLNETLPATLFIKCSVNARVDVTIEGKKGSQQFLLKHLPCSDFISSKIYEITDYTDNVERGVNNTVYVHLYEFRKPAIIEIYFAQFLKS